MFAFSYYVVGKCLRVQRWVHIMPVYIVSTSCCGLLVQHWRWTDPCVPNVLRETLTLRNLKQTDHNLTFTFILNKFSHILSKHLILNSSGCEMRLFKIGVTLWQMILTNCFLLYWHKKRLNCCMMCIIAATTSCKSLLWHYIHARTGSKSLFPASQ